MIAVFAQILLASGLLLLYRWLNRTSVAQVPGPPSTSWIHGNLPYLFTGQVGEREIELTKTYGSIVRLQGNFGESHLLISDPKAIQYIHQNTDRFTRRTAHRTISTVFVGPGVALVEGDDHKRHRKLMGPAFGPQETKALLPVMSACVSSVVEKWNELVQGSEDQSVVIDFPSWIGRGTLDAIGQGAFDYDFGAVQNKDDPLSLSFQNLLLDVSGKPNRAWLMTQTVMGYIPIWILGALVSFLPVERFRRLRTHKKLAEATARKLIVQKMQVYNSGNQGGKDAMSLIVQANASQHPSEMMSTEEVIAQLIWTLMIAGHETTATSITWTLIELCKNPQLQTRLREEIRARERFIHQRGDSEFALRDLEAMPYLNAIIKETLRYNSPAIHMNRESLGDDLLPLSAPITTSEGKVLYELPIPKGQNLITSLSGHHMSEEIFGPNPDTFNPDRWLDDIVSKPEVSIGVYSHLLTFSMGSRSCIGWRFAVQEMQIFLVELIRNFEFTLAVPVDDVIRAFGGTMVPEVKGHEEKGAYLPMRIRLASLESES